MAATDVALWREHSTLVTVLLVVAAIAASLHHRGITWGDDYALYLRQARSVLDGNVGDVIADNHFNVDNAAKPASAPTSTRGGFPLLMAPFVRLFGLDYAKLKLVEVACLIGFLSCFHAVIRRRMARWNAFATVAAIGTSLAYLRHTEFLVRRVPYMFAAAATLWWLDHLRRDDRPLDLATSRQLVALGLLAMLVFNIRREGLAIDRCDQRRPTAGPARSLATR